MKKGFTLVEIILSISLVLIIGAVSLISFNLIKKQNLVKNLNAMRSTIYQAMNVYIETHNETKEQLYNKKNGVAIPLVTLEKEGLIDFGNLDIEDQFVVTALAEENDCSDPSELPSWDFGQDRILYICSDADQAIKTLEERIGDLETEMLSLSTLPNALSSKIDAESNEIQTKINTESNEIQTKINELKNDLNTINTKIQNLSNGGVDTSTNIGKARNEAYFYKGAIANNYIKISNQTTRIIMIDIDNSIVVADPYSSLLRYSDCLEKVSGSFAFSTGTVELISGPDTALKISWMYSDVGGVGLCLAYNDCLKSEYAYAYRLKNNIKITGGTGAPDNPFTIDKTC